MRLRPYIDALDYPAIERWITDPRTHAMWCADLIPFPLSRNGFGEALRNVALKHCDTPFVATTEEGAVIGFFCYSVNLEANAGKLKFVVIDPAHRGEGLGRTMLCLACRYAFFVSGVSEVRLVVFSANAAAQRCYEAVGFREDGFDSDAFHFGEEVWGRREMVIRAEELSGL